MSISNIVLRSIPWTTILSSLICVQLNCSPIFAQNGNLTSESSQNRSNFQKIQKLGLQDIFDEILNLPRQQLLELVDKASLSKTTPQSISFSYIAQIKCNNDMQGTLKYKVDQLSLRHIVEDFYIVCGAVKFDFSLSRKGVNLMQLSLLDWLELNFPPLASVQEMHFYSAKGDSNFTYSRKDSKSASLELTKYTQQDDLFRFRAIKKINDSGSYLEFFVDAPGEDADFFSQVLSVDLNGILTSQWLKDGNPIAENSFEQSFLIPIKSKLKLLFAN